MMSAGSSSVRQHWMKRGTANWCQSLFGRTVELNKGLETVSAVLPERPASPLFGIRLNPRDDFLKERLPL
jgi:hypothetical protein